MNTENKKPEFMLLFRGQDWHKGLSPEEIQTVIGRMMEWFKKLGEQGKALAGSPLEPEGKVISMKNGKIMADGPFAESKEAIGGYFLLSLNTLDEAVAIAKQCPILEYGAKVEVRQVAESCPLAAECKSMEQLEPAHAHA